jgi:RecB family endonuclease NucS
LAEEAQMPVEMALWRMNEAGPTPVKFVPLDVEQRLEDMIANDLTLVDGDLLMVARQVRTDFGGIIDILAVDAEGHLHLLELKRDRTPREIVAQILDYGSWVQSLTVEKVSTIYADEREDTLEDAFAD